VNDQPHIANGRIDHGPGDVENQIAIKSEHIVSREANERFVPSNER
jgi:hypothetical protein